MADTSSTVSRSSEPKPLRPSRTHCSFCGKRASDVRFLVAGQSPSVAICDECVYDAAMRVAAARSHAATVTAEIIEKESAS